MNKIYEDITIVTVLYNSAQINEIFFENLKNFKTIVVDNGKNEEILDKIKTYKNIEVISKNKNLGYGNAVNFAFKNITTKFFLKCTCTLTLVFGKYYNQFVQAQ